MIDWDRLAELQADIGEEDFAEIGAVFLAEMQEKLAEITARPDAATAADFHYLKGSASNFGLGQFAEACAAAELAVGAGLEPNIDGLNQVFSASVAELGGLLDAA